MNVTWIHNYYIVFYNAHTTPKARTKSLMNEERKIPSIRNINLYYCSKKIEERCTQDYTNHILRLKFQFSDFKKLYQPTLQFPCIWKNQSTNSYSLVTCTWKSQNWLASYYKWSKHILLQIPIKSLDTTNHHFSCYKINSPQCSFKLNTLSITSTKCF